MKAKAAHAHDQQAAAPFAIFMAFFSGFSRVNRSGTGKPFFRARPKIHEEANSPPFKSCSNLGIQFPTSQNPDLIHSLLAPKMEKHQPRFQLPPPSPPSSS